MTSQPWFNAEVWEPYKFKPTPVPFILPDEIKNAFNGPLGRPIEPQPATYQPAYVPAAHEGIAAAEDEGAPLNLAPPVPPPAIPGLVGELVAHAWQSASAQIAEVAVASALSAMSLLCSRTYRHGTLGLNLYLLVLAQTSTGKSFGFRANDNWMNALQQRFEGIKPPHSEEAKKRLEVLRKMIMGEIGSAQGLSHHMAESPSTLAHLDEYVQMIQLMNRVNCPAHISQLRAEILRLMEMSGPGRIYRGRKYSKRSGQPEEIDVLMASFSILATGTPEDFYDDISANLLTNGFLPRFTILEYEGSITQPNLSPITQPPAELIDKLMFIFNQNYLTAQTLTGNIKEIIDCVPNESGKQRLQWFDNVCMRRTIEANEKGWPSAGLWARAKDHVRQVASLIAIGVNPTMPTIDGSHVDIAISIVRKNVDKLSDKVSNFEIGIGDDRRIGEIRKIMAKMYALGWNKYRNMPGVRRDHIDNGLITISAVRNYCVRLAPFKNHPLGSNRAFDDALNAMVKYGEVQQVTVPNEKAFVVKLNLDVFMPILKSIAKS